MDLLIGLDLGTSAIKGILVSTEGKLLAREKRPVEYIYPRQGWVEFCPNKYYGLVCECIRSLAANAPEKESIMALCMAAASGNTVLLDEQAEPLYNGISWMDERGLEDDGILLSGLDYGKVHEIAGWPWLRVFPLAHLAWLKKYKPEAYSKARYPVMNISYIYHKLAGRFGIDPSTATTSYLLDQKNRCWHKPYLDALGITKENLPPILDSGTLLGTLTACAAEKTGLSRDTKVVLGAFDHPCAARGTGVWQKGDFLLSCGTSWVSFFPLRDRSQALSLGLLIDPFMQPTGPWGAILSIPGIGKTIDWFIHRLTKNENQAVDPYRCFEEKTDRAPIGAQGLRIPVSSVPQDCEKYFAQIARGRAPEDLCRAVIEGTAMEMRKKIETLLNAGIRADRLTLAGGPSESRIWTQILSNVLGLELKLVHGRIAGAMGAAILAGMGAGLFKDERDGLARLKSETRTVYPDLAAKKAYDEIHATYWQNKDPME